MHPLIFGNSFAVLVAPILLFGLAFYFLCNKQNIAHSNAKDADTTPTEINSIASSSSTAPTGNCYDVFLSFRGPDTRDGFTDHLYNRLHDAGIQVFRDDEDLRQGEKIGLDLLAAIRNSKILIPILSMNYGSSKWCLDELDEMMKCKNNNPRCIVLPIFYKVKPYHVRRQRKDFGKAFRTCERYFGQTIMEKWKQALIQVSSLKGLEVKGYEGKFVKMVVQKVLIELKKKIELVLPENLVGLDSPVKKVMKFVDDISDATVFIGIHGMGGIGKTTLAKTIYNKLFDKFEHRSFIEDVRESCKQKGLVYLQNQLIFHILGGKEQVHTMDEGNMFISSKFKSKKVLLFLDDVDDDNQLKALAGNHDWFSSGSRIFITTRKKSILDYARVDHNYEHEGMDENQSLILLSRHAFRRDSPPSELEGIAHEVVYTTGGLPLSLEVLGSFLCGKQLPVWRDTLKKLKEMPRQEVHARFMISYEELDYTQQQIFLDIACFFIGTDRRTASYMWDACDFFPEEGIEVLRLMSLIKIGDNDELKMHDQLRDFGRKIVREENQQEPQYRSRLWNLKEALKVVQGKKGTEKIQAIYLENDCDRWRNTRIYRDEQLKNLTSLRFLDVRWGDFRGDFKNSLEKLRWFRWESHYPTFEVNNFHLKELVVLDLSSSNILDEWQGWSFMMMAEKLKFLDLSYTCLKGTFFLTAFKNLEVLILRSCNKLEQIDSSIGDMKNLVRLDLTGCWILKELPTELGKLEALEELLLEGCQDFSKVPDSIGALKNLKIMNIHRTHVEELPDSIGALQNLEFLHISGSWIKELPYDIGRLRKLRVLDAAFCISLGEKIPESIRNLSSLQHLDLNGCKKLQLPPELPSSLTYLRITCQNCSLPSLSHLTHLEELQLHYCKFLGCIMEFPSTLSGYSQLRDVEESKLSISLNTLLKLKIIGCKLMHTLDVSQSNCVRTLSVDQCDNLLEVRGLDKLKCLEILIIKSSSLLKRLDLSKLEHLKILDIQSCVSLKEIQCLDKMFLEELHISKCSIERLDLSKSKSLHLKILDIQSCVSLKEIQGLDKLEFLEELHISECSIERLDLLKSKSLHLKILYIQSCVSLKEIQGLDKLEFLEELDISECSIERLDLLKSKSLHLKILNIRLCVSLKEIQGLNKLEVLELHISECSIERLDLSKSKILHLKILDIQSRVSLKEIQGLNKLEFLELYISKCSIERLDLPKSKSLHLKNLGIQSCVSLKEIQCLDKMFLEELHISKCSIERLDLSKSKSLHLKILDIQSCVSLKEIQGLDKLEFLEELHISKCSIERLDLPKSKSLHLKILDIQSCVSLKEIQGLDKLEFLEELDISECSIERLDLSKSKSLHLKILKIQSCVSLKEIQGLDKLEFLEELHISEWSIERLDLSKSKSLHLKILEIRSCVSLKEIQGLDKLEFLEELHISECSIERLDLSKSKSLKILNARFCKSLVDIEGYEKLELLKNLNTYGSTLFNGLRGLPLSG